MSGKYFIDTNILVYANDPAHPEKQEKSAKIIYDGIMGENMVLSTQVMSEFYVTVTQKREVKIPKTKAKKQILLLKNLETVDIDFSLILSAVEISDEHVISFWDSLIIAAALKSKCDILYSEDLNHGQRIQSVQIMNPFI
jgi:predicted nucleic acid-binding protein